MKKFATLFVALALCMGLAVPAFAAEYGPQTYTSNYDSGSTTVTIDKVDTQSDWYAHIPVGAVVTVTAGQPSYGRESSLCLAKGYYLDGENLTLVHWSYDPVAGTMVQTNDAGYTAHANCPKLAAGETYSFTMTQEIADSFAIFNTAAEPWYQPYIDLNAGFSLDQGPEITVPFVFDDANTPAEPENPVQPEKPSESETPAEPTFSWDNPFADVDADAYYAPAVEWALKNGVTTGTSNTTFSPDAVCTRAQIVTFLWRAAGCPAPESSENPFTDLDAGSYYYDAVLWAVDQGVASGTGDGKFSPDSVCTRSQSVTFLYRAFGSPEVSGNASFSDVVADSYYADAVVWAEQNGITGGIGGGLFGSANDCTRAQILTFLYRGFVK